MNSSSVIFVNLQNEDKCLINSKTYEVSPSEKLAAEPEKYINKNGLNSTDVSIATMSKVDIVIVPLERRNSKSDYSVEDNKNRCSRFSSESESDTALNGPLFKEDKLQKITKQHSKTEDVNFKKTVIGEMDDCNDTMKLLQPISEVQNMNDQVTILS